MRNILKLNLISSHDSHSSHSDHGSHGSHSSHSNHNNTDTQNWDNSKLSGISFPSVDDTLSAAKYANLMKNLNIIRSAVGLSQGSESVSGNAMASQYNGFKLQLKKNAMTGVTGGTYYNGISQGGTDWIDIPGNATSQQSLLTDVLGYSDIQSRILAVKNLGIPSHASTNHHEDHGDHGSHSSHDSHSSHTNHDSHDSHSSHTNHQSHSSTAVCTSNYTTPFRSTDSCYRT